MLANRPALAWAQVWIWAVGAMVHHAFGGGLMFAGWLLGNETLWKHGMLTEVGGMDAGDLLFRLPWCLIKPPGPYPMSNLVASKAPYLYLQARCRMKLRVLCCCAPTSDTCNVMHISRDLAAATHLM